MASFSSSGQWLPVILFLLLESGLFPPLHWGPSMSEWDNLKDTAFPPSPHLDTEGLTGHHFTLLLAQHPAFVIIQLFSDWSIGIFSEMLGNLLIFSEMLGNSVAVLWKCRVPPKWRSFADGVSETGSGLSIFQYC